MWHYQHRRDVPIRGYDVKEATRPRIKFTRKQPSPCHELATNSRDCNIAGPSNCGAGARSIFSEAIREGETSADRIVVRAERGIRGWARGPEGLGGARERRGMRRRERNAHIRLSRTYGGGGRAAWHVPPNYSNNKTILIIISTSVWEHTALRRARRIGRETEREANNWRASERKRGTGWGGRKTKRRGHDDRGRIMTIITIYMQVPSLPAHEQSTHSISYLI